MKNFLIKNGFLVSLFFAIFFAIVITWPGILHINSSYFGDGGDNYEYASYQSLASQRIENGELPFGTNNFWRFPVGFDFSRGFDSYITVSIGALLKTLVGMPLSYNLTIYILMTLNGVLSYLFFYKLTKSKALSLIGMLIYGFSFYSIGKAGSHPNLLFTGGISLFFLSLLRLSEAESHSFKEYIIFFSSLLVITMGSNQYLLMLLTLVPLYAITTFLFFKNETLLFIKKIKIKPFLITGFVFSFIFLILYFPHIKAFLNHSIVFLDRKDILFNFTPSIFEYIFPNPYLKLLVGNLIHAQNLASIEKVVFIGFIELIVFIIFLAHSIISRNKYFIYLTSLFLIPFALSLGFGKDNSFFLLPYRFLSNIFPFSLIPETGRYYVFFYFFLTIAFILFLKKLNIKNKNLIFGIIILLLFIERLPTSFYMSPSLRDQDYQRVVKMQNSEAVLDLPIDFYYAPYDINSFSYNKPIVNGYFHWSADSDKERSFITKDNLLDRYICSKDDPLQNNQLDGPTEAFLDQRMISLLKENQINTIVIHKDNKFFHDECKNIRKRLSNLLSFPSSLEITGANEKQIAKEYWEGKAIFKYYFPYDGVFYLDGTYIAPNKPTDFNIMVDNANLPNYSWTIKDDYSMELSPKYTISFPVKSGSVISFYSPTETSNSYFSLWYRYIVDKQTYPIIGYQPILNKVFEDDKSIVLQLN